MEKYKKYLAKAKELGAADARVIETKTVVTARWVWLKCQFGCPQYGKRLACPPRTPRPKKTKKLLREYEHALLVHAVTSMKELNRIVVELEKAIFLDGLYKAFALGSGPCSLCEECSLEECRHPYEARPSMEACGIDVFSTVKEHGYPIGTLEEKGEDGNFYGLVLIE